MFYNDELEKAVSDFKSIIRATALLNENMKESIEKVIEDAKSINW